MALLPAYLLKGATRRAVGMFNSLIVGGLITRSLSTGITASATQTLAGAAALASEINVVTTVAAAGNAVKLPVLAVGQTVEVFNNGANAASVFPAASNTKIDGGANGAAVTLSAGARARFTGVTATTVISALFGAVSA